jgi:heme/copper-type cytochrome/quinol oxidase subunit 2
MAEEKSSSVVSIFAMVLLTVVVLVLLYFFVIKGLTGKKEIDININKGSYKLEKVTFDRFV